MKGGSIPADSRRDNARGFSLIEAMIAMLVLSIGLLGVAGIQILSLRATLGAYARSQATLAAYDIVDRMRANLPAVADDHYWLDPDNPPSNPDIGGGCRSGACTPAQLAQTDLALWLESLDDHAGFDLTSGTARIRCSARPCAPGSMVTVSVIWDEQRRGATDRSCPDRHDPARHLACFHVSVVL